MSQLRRAAMTWSRLIGTTHPNRRVPSTFFTSPKLFSTEAAEPTLGFSDDQFNRSSGLVYGALGNITKHTTKADIINVLEGCELNPNNLKVEYDQRYFPLSMLVEFPSKSAYDAGIRAINRKGRFYSMKAVDKSRWDTTNPEDGKAILLCGIPRNALMDDIDRFLSGCHYYSSSIEFLNRSLNQRVVKSAVVRFPSQALATHAYITKNRGFCLNDHITVQVLH